jgi:hypothetical protein
MGTVRQWQRASSLRLGGGALALVASFLACSSRVPNEENVAAGSSAIALSSLWESLAAPSLMES